MSHLCQRNTGLPDSRSHNPPRFCAPCHTRVGQPTPPTTPLLLFMAEDNHQIATDFHGTTLEEYSNYLIEENNSLLIPNLTAGPQCSRWTDPPATSRRGVS